MTSYGRVKLKKYRHAPPIYRPALRATKPALAWAFTPAFLLVFSCLALVQDSTPNRQDVLDCGMPARGRLHRALYQQGISRNHLRLPRMKRHLAELVRHHNRVCIVGGGARGRDVIEFASIGYKVDAFQVASRYIASTTRSVRALRLTGVTMHHAVAGAESGGHLVLQSENNELVSRRRIDDTIKHALDVLEVGTRAFEMGAIYGASRLIQSTGAGVRSILFQIPACSAQIAPLLKQLDVWDYALFDTVPHGVLTYGEMRVSAVYTDMALDMGWNTRPSKPKKYARWLCDMKKNHWHSLHVDIVAIRRDLVTPELMLALNTLGVNSLTQS